MRADTEYLSATFFNDGDAEIKARRVSMVTTRAEHPCALGCHPILAGSRALYETAIAEGEHGRCWCCVSCMDRYLDTGPGSSRDGAA